MKRCILVVDDDLEITKLLCEALAQEYQTIPAFNGYQAVAAIMKRNPKVDLVITDLEMPGLSGFEFWDYLPESVAEKIPTIVIAGYLHLPDSKKGIKSLKPDEAFEKPVDISSLREAAHRLINHSSEANVEETRLT